MEFGIGMELYKEYYMQYSTDGEMSDIRVLKRYVLDNGEQGP
jgi:hypothetical protein